MYTNTFVLNGIMLASLALGFSFTVSLSTYLLLKLEMFHVMNCCNVLETFKRSFLPQEGKLQEAVESLLSLEKQTRTVSQTNS